MITPIEQTPGVGKEISSKQKNISEAEPEMGKVEQVQESIIDVTFGSDTDVEINTVPQATDLIEKNVEESILSDSKKDIAICPAQNQASRGPNAMVLSRWRLVVLSITLCCGLFLSLLDTSIVATALFSIGDEFDVVGEVTWVALAYTLTYLGCCTIFSSVADVIGRRNAYIAAFIIFFSFSLGCGFASTLEQLIACRALQGLGGAGLYSLTFVIFPEISPPKLQQWIGIMAGLVVALASVGGPLLGGILTHYSTWRWCFWINAPVGILPLISFIVAWPPACQTAHIRRRRRFRELDFVGCVLMTAASVLTVFAFQEGGLGNNIWSTGLFIGPLVVGCCCWVLLFGWEVTVARIWEDSVAAIFPLRLLKRRVYMAGMLAAILTGFPYFVVIYALPLRFQVVNQKSPLIAGIGLIPMLGSSAVGSMVGGFLNGKKNRCFQTLVAGPCAMLIGTGLLTTLSPSLNIEAKVYGFQVFVGLGFGLTVSTASLLAILECQIRDASVATGIVAQVRVLGGSIGIAASSAILGVTQRSELTGVISVGQLAALQRIAPTLTPSQLIVVRQAYSDSFEKDMIMCSAVSAICILVALATWQHNPLPPPERRKEQIAEEVQRQTKIAIDKAKRQAIMQAHTQAEAKERS